MNKLVVDFAVIGSGPAGQKSAIQAAKLGKKVAIIEKDLVPGGYSLNSGTIPSKSLREAIIDMTRYNERSFYGASCLKEITIQDLNYRLNTVLEGERAILIHQFRKNKIQFVNGLAQFEDSNNIGIFDENSKKIANVIAEKILIATGSVPRNPINVPFDREVILDSTSLLHLEKVPKTMIVLGGGIVGTEYASFFAALGCKVTVLDKKHKLLPDLDGEIGTHLQVGLKETGLHFYPFKIPKLVRRIKDVATVVCEDGSVYESEILLYALGREANIKNLLIDKAGIQLNERGYIPVNEYFQTNIENIYAAGDVIGYPALASTSMEQGRIAACHAFGVTTHLFPKIFPLGIYTIPEISSIGYTEEEIQNKGIPYEVGRAYYYEIARSHIAGSSHLGMFKLIFNSKTLELLGIHIVGRSATELIHVGQVAMLLNGKLNFFIDQIFNYPTFTEGYRIAALNGVNKL